MISKNNNCKIPYVSRESPIKLIEFHVPSKRLESIAPHSSLDPPVQKVQRVQPNTVNVYYVYIHTDQYTQQHLEANGATPMYWSTSSLLDHEGPGECQNVVPVF